MHFKNNEMDGIEGHSQSYCNRHHQGRPSSLLGRWGVILVSVFIWVYRIGVSPILHSFGAGGCRYTPSCSEYALESFERHGFWQGMSYAIKRLSRCHPFSKRWGWDPVP